MRGSGYAIGEILIFLAIAAIIGFLIGWLVFYRRPEKAPTGLAPTNPNHVKRLEERAKTAEAKVTRIEKRANLLLESLSKVVPPAATAAAPGDTGDKKTSIAPAAPAPNAKTVEATDKPADSMADNAEAAKQATADNAEAAADAAKQATAAKAEEAKQATDAKAEEAEQATVDKAESAKPDVGKKPAAPEVTKEAAPTKDDGVDDYLTEADDRISKLEETLDKLSAKLAELEDD